MRWFIILTVTFMVTPVAAENLLVNPDFDLDPTVPGNGWSNIGTGSFLWIQTNGDPMPPSARTDQIGDESMVLFQCVSINGAMSLDFSARSYTHSSIGMASNGVFLSVFPTGDCSGDPIETVTTDQNSAPNWYFRERVGYISPANTLSARIELSSEANGTNNFISWDNVMLSSQIVATDTRYWGSIKAIYK